MMPGVIAALGVLPGVQLDCSKWVRPGAPRVLIATCGFSLLASTDSCFAGAVFPATATDASFFLRQPLISQPMPLLVRMAYLSWWLTPLSLPEIKL